MSASLGPNAALDLAKALTGLIALPQLATTAAVALTASSADPGTTLVAEVAYAGYTRQNVSFAANGSGVSTTQAAAFNLPSGITVTGVALLTSRYSTVFNPLLWFDLPTPLTTAEALALVVPAGSISFNALAHL